MESLRSALDVVTARPDRLAGLPGADPRPHHESIRASRDSRHPGVEKANYGYGDDPGNLARQSVGELLEGFTQILSGCRALLKPGGFLVIAARPFRRLGQLVDIPTMATNAALDVGFTLHERCVALLAATRDSGLMARSSFFQLVNSRNAFAAGSPTHVTAHEEIVVARVGKADESAAEAAGSGRAAFPISNFAGRAAAA